MRLLLGWIADAVLVPQRAIQAGQGGPYVMVVQEDGKAEQRFVQVGGDSREHIIIREHLSVDEVVIVEGVHKVRPGQNVQIVDAPKPPPESETVTEPETR